eukprot:14226927-Alexandrium_andersonii.AAC.1
MSASLVGSEMCIRDRPPAPPRALLGTTAPTRIPPDQRLRRAAGTGRGSPGGFAAPRVGPQ